MALSRLIVNADDFGYSESVNRAIVCGFESSLVNSTSLMANMPGFDHAIGLIRKHPFLQRHAGLHLNLTEGYALSRALSACPTFCGSGGLFIYHRERLLFRLSRRERAAVYEEMEMQLERVVAAGIRPTHLDSHHHAHTEWAIAPLVCRLARANGIERVRLTRNMGLVPSRLKRWYKKVFNHWFLGRRSGLNNTDFFGDIRDMNYVLRGGAGGERGRARGERARPGREDLCYEIMVHPLFDASGGLVDFDGKDLRQELLPLLQTFENFEFTTIDL
jgi:predicted glycoside hydrolase/deacetylase ChbG (UPF0249 family)